MQISNIFQKLLDKLSGYRIPHELSKSSEIPTLTSHEFNKILERISRDKRNLKDDEVINTDVNCYVKTSSNSLCYYNWLETSGNNFLVLAQPLHFSKKDNHTHFVMNHNEIDCYRLVVGTLSGNGIYKNHHEDSIILNTQDRDLLKEIVSKTVEFYLTNKSVEKTLEWLKTISPFAQLYDSSKTYK